MRILIADDEPATRAVVRRILMRHFPCDVSEVDNGLDALDRLAAVQHSLLLLDVKMPLMNGVETLRAIRGHARTANLPVIVMTGTTEEQVVHEIMSLGVSDYVIKPVRPAVIVERVARIAGGLTVAAPPAPRRTRASRVQARLAPPPPACCSWKATRTSRRCSARSSARMSVSPRRRPGSTHFACT